MDNATSNRLRMIGATLQFLEKNSDKTALLPGYAAVKAAVDGKVTQIHDNNRVALSSIKGVTEHTNKLRYAMCEITEKCACAVKAYAFSTGDDTLLDKVDYTFSKLKRIDKDAVAEICQTIHDEANTHIADASNYGITAGDVTALQNSIDLYTAGAQNPRDAQIARKQANANVKQLVKEVIQILKAQLDPMINTLRLTEPSFVDMHFMAREIINLGIIHTQVKGTVSDSAGTLLSGALLTVTDTTSGGTIGTVRTEREGKFKLRLVPGNYDLAWTLNNFQTVTELNVRFIQGKMVRRKVVLKAA